MMAPWKASLISKWTPWPKTTHLLPLRPQASQEAAIEKTAWFIANVQVSGGGPSVSMVMKTFGDAENGAAWHPTLNLPLSPKGTVQTSVEFQVSTRTPSLSTPLGSSPSLHCGSSMAPGLALISVEWRLQHKGSGQLENRWTTGQEQAHPTQPHSKGRGGLHLLITTSLYQAQQIIQLDIRHPSSSKNRTALDKPSSATQTTCSITGYYPLDVAVTWTREEPGRAPVQVSGASFSSLRQSAAGTYSISSSLAAETGSAGATYTCQVTHISLEEPLRASAWVAPPETATAFGVLLASSLFLLALLLLGLQRRQATSPSSGKILGSYSPASE